MTCLSLSSFLQIGDLGPGQYNLTVSGYEGLTFSNTTALQYVHKSYSVFIQTDKSIYKPGDLLQFRVIVVNPQLRPSVTGAIDVFITVCVASVCGSRGRGE